MTPIKINVENLDSNKSLSPSFNTLESYLEWVNSRDTKIPYSNIRTPDISSFFIKARLIKTYGSLEALGFLVNNNSIDTELDYTGSIRTMKSIPVSITGNSSSNTTSTTSKIIPTTVSIIDLNSLFKKATLTTTSLSITKIFGSSYRALTVSNTKVISRLDELPVHIKFCIISSKFKIMFILCYTWKFWSFKLIKIYFYFFS